MGILGSGSIHMANRYAKKPAYRTANAATTVCQKCLQAGHWTYECKNVAAYQSRPTRTKQLTDPKYKPRFLAPGELLPEHRDKEPQEAVGKPAKGGKKRKKKPAASSSSSDDSSSSDSDSASSSSSSDDSSSDDSSSSSSGSDSDSDSSSGTSSSSSDGSDDFSSSDSDSSSSSDSDASSGPPSPEPPSRKKARKLAEAAPVAAKPGATKSHKGGERAARAEREPKGDLRERRGERESAGERRHESNGVSHHEEERAVAKQRRPKIRSTVVARD